VKHRNRARHILLCIQLFTMTNCAGLFAQSGTSSAITGTVLDTSGAALLGAQVTATEVDTKATRTVQTDSNGRFLFSQVNPGTYTVTVHAPGFAEQASQPIAVQVSRTAALNFNLAVSGTSQTVEVNAQQTLLTLENPNTTTTIESEAIANLPNAGSDVTFVAQFAAGALMNTAGSSNDNRAPADTATSNSTDFLRLRTATSLTVTIPTIRGWA
jgi:Carboxypeptidase regulatory-like domain